MDEFSAKTIARLDCVLLGILNEMINALKKKKNSVRFSMMCDYKLYEFINIIIYVQIHV